MVYLSGFLKFHHFKTSNERLPSQFSLGQMIQLFILHFENLYDPSKETFTDATFSLKPGAFLKN